MDGAFVKNDYLNKLIIPAYVFIIILIGLMIGIYVYVFKIHDDKHDEIVDQNLKLLGIESMTASTTLVPGEDLELLQFYEDPHPTDPFIEIHYTYTSLPTALNFKVKDWVGKDVTDTVTVLEHTPNFRREKISFTFTPGSTSYKLYYSLVGGENLSIIKILLKGKPS